jgi:hypothetical protein
MEEVEPQCSLVKDGEKWISENDLKAIVEKLK